MLSSQQLLIEPDRGIERKLATVMFVDVEGSMSLSTRIELEQWWCVTASLFELMCQSVYDFGGWIGSFTGDGIEGVFDQVNDTHARAACDAALWLLDAIRTPAEELQAEHGLRLSIRIGIHSGEILTGVIGDRYKRYYTAHGYAVALAKRIEALAPPNRVYLSNDTALSLNGCPSLAVRDVGAFDVKGATRPVRIWELVTSRSNRGTQSINRRDRK